MEKATIVIIVIIILIFGSFAGFLGVSNDKIENSENNNTDNKNQNYTEAFTFSLLGGGVKNTSVYKGKIVLLDFMGATCGPCQNMMYVLKQLSLDYPDIEIVSINVWIINGETPELLQQMVDLFSQSGVELDWTFGYDDNQYSLYYKYVNGGVPKVLVLDKNGNIYYTKNGYIDGYQDYDILSEKIEELL